MRRPRKRVSEASTNEYAGNVNTVKRRDIRCQSARDSSEIIRCAVFARSKVLTKNIFREE